MSEKEIAIKDLKEFYQNNGDFIGWNRIELYGIKQKVISNCGVKKVAFERDSNARFVPYVEIKGDELIIFDPKVREKIHSDTYDEELQKSDSEFVVTKLKTILDL